MFSFVKLLIPLLFIVIFGFSSMQIKDSSNNNFRIYKSKIKLLRNKPDSIVFYANEYLKKAIHTKDLKGQLFAYRDLGNAYLRLTNYNYSKINNLKGLKVALRLKKDAFIKNMQNQLALSYRHLNMPDSALYFFRKSITNLDSISFPSAMLNYNLGISHLKYQKYLDSASYYFKVARNNFESLNNKRLVASCLNLNGEVYLLKKEYKIALELANESNLYIAHNNLDVLKSSNYFLLSKIYEGLNNKPKAKEFYEKSISKIKPKSNSSLSSLNSEISNKNANIHSNFQKEIVADKKKATQKLTYSILVALVLFIISIWFIYKKQKTKKKLLEVREELLKLKDRNKYTKKNTPTLITLKSKAVLKSNEILYLKSDGHYVEYYLESKKNPEIDRNTLTNALTNLPKKEFIRIHKSYIIPINRIKIINSTKIMLDTGKWINLSRTYKQELYKLLNK